MPFADDTLATSPAVTALRARIGWFCKTLRCAGPLYAAWVLLTMILFWSDGAGATRYWGNWLHLQLPEIPRGQLVAGFAVHFVLWIFVAGACINIWRLFSGFLEGRVFTVDAALLLRCIAIFGLVAECGDMLSRPLISTIVTAHMPPGAHVVSVFFLPNDLLNIIFLGGFLALGHVFKVAAEIADDHAAIV